MRLRLYPATPFIGLFGNRDLKALLGRHECSLESCRAATHDQHALWRGRFRKFLGVPAASPLLTRGGVLRAAHRHTVVPAGNTDVAANAFPDGIAVALANFRGQKGVGNAGTRATNQVEHASANLRHHGVR